MRRSSLVSTLRVSGVRFFSASKIRCNGGAFCPTLALSFSSDDDVPLLDEDDERVLRRSIFVGSDTFVFIFALWSLELDDTERVRFFSTRFSFGFERDLDLDDDDDDDEEEDEYDRLRLLLRRLLFAGRCGGGGAP